MRPKAIAFAAFVSLASAQAHGQGTLVRGEASMLAVASSAADADRQLNVRVIPEMQTGFALSPAWTVDVAAAARATAGATYLSSSQVSTTREVDLHRAWLRVSSPRFEVRAGLQKISFGSSSLFRPLMWFDRVDPRDPTQYSEGVYALLARYVTQGNHSAWVWGLYGDEEVRGWDSLPTRRRTPEFGGRGQLALARGELAATYHHRRLDVAPFAAPLPVIVPGSPFDGVGNGAPVPSGPISAPEDRVGVDGKWDIGPGVWFEAAFTRTDSTLVRRRWQRALSVGADYTFRLGRGVTLLAEHFVLQPAVPLGAPAGEVKLTAVTGSYPLGAADSVGAVVYYEWNREDLFRFVEWRRTWDHWRLHVIGFWNPAIASVFAARAQTSALTGRGVQLAVVVTY